ncbi:hypothetical protein [Vibrio splendidus]|uniref:hypothetical protein n=1 Tax=Vibrio splendidus TaxID=29497 RepID=UPI0002F8D446|nr:hypothetical protein [Vibrio splendidus]UOE82175.1 hypothetical protein LTQ03_15710 [Vibrio splendidus]
MTEKILNKAQLKQMGVRLPKGVVLSYTETDKEYLFNFALKKTGKRGHNGK